MRGWRFIGWRTPPDISERTLVPEYRLSCYALIPNPRGEILLLQRAGGDRLFPGQWEIPGGKMDIGEGIQEALLREVYEEAGLKIAPGPLAGAVEMPRKTFHVVMLVFHAVAEQHAVTLSHEHAAQRWVRPQELPAMDLTPPLRRFLEEHPKAMAQLPS